MTERRIPDPTLMARLQLSVKGVDWAASLVAPWQHEELEGSWSPHRQVWHLLAVERENYQPRIARILSESRPRLEAWDGEGSMREAYDRSAGIDALAEEFMREREKTVGTFKDLTPEQWQRTAVWPDGREVDLAWVAEKVLWHALDHFAALLDMHQDFDQHHSRRWLSSA